MEANKSQTEDENQEANPLQLQVIGAGLMRTGTTSLKLALEMLLQKPCYHMSTVALEHKEPAISGWLSVFKLETPDPIFFKKMYQNYAAAIDYPTCAFYQTLVEIYPNAKVILTVRDTDQWVASCRATMLSSEMMMKPSIGRRLVHWLSDTCSLLPLHELMFAKTLGPDLDNDTALAKAYMAWNRTVKDHVPTDRLLVFNPADGWEPLCRFLDLHSPSSSIPFPHVNRREDMSRVLNEQLKRGRLFDKLFFLLGLIFCIIFFKYLFL